MVINISRGKYEPIPEALIQYGDIIPSLLSVNPKSRFSASKVLEILEAPDKNRELYDTPVVVKSVTKNPSASEDMLATVKVEPIASVKSENISQPAVSFKSFGAAWDQGAMAESPGIGVQYDGPYGGLSDGPWWVNGGLNVGLNDSTSRQYEALFDLENDWNI